MMQKPWFKMFMWIMASSFFFFASSAVISLFSPGPSEEQVMKFMAGMMNAMENSTMGLAMSMENNSELKQLIGLSSIIIIPIIAMAAFLGIYLRIRRRKDSAG